jgi:hypothetical protein
MDPIRIAVAVAIGAPLGTILGYFVYAAQAGADGASRLGRWAFDFYPGTAFGWAIFGAAIGVGLLYLSRGGSGAI